ncbi:GNAT family N-acetyltransferase [Halobacteriales archaeon Cl-PHB]
MEFAVLGWGPDGPTLGLDHEVFAYAGKFVMSQTGKAVARDGEELVGAVATSPDRTDESTLRIRYVTVRKDRRGEEIGPRLLRFVAEAALDEGYEDVCIAVNNPFAFEAASKAGYHYTGEETGVAELVMAFGPEDRSAAAYRAGLDVYRERDLSTREVEFLASREGSDPPATLHPSG